MYGAKFVGLNSNEIDYLKLLLKTTKKDLPNIKLDQEVDCYKKPQLFLRIMNSVGLFIQRIGQAVSNFGHRIHSCNNLMILIITILHPILLKFFDYEKLHKLKRKIMK